MVANRFLGEVGIYKMNNKRTEVGNHLLSRKNVLVLAPPTVRPIVQIVTESG